RIKNLLREFRPAGGRLSGQSKIVRYVNKYSYREHNAKVRRPAKVCQTRAKRNEMFPATCRFKGSASSPARRCGVVRRCRAALSSATWRNGLTALRFDAAGRRVLR